MASAPSEMGTRGISILTWNVWFGSLARRQRFTAILEDVYERSPDVACFQEVVCDFIGILHAHNGLMETYVCSPNRIGQYGCLTLVKRSLSPEFNEIALLTRMDRSLILATFANNSIAVGNVHLESLDNERARKIQLHACHETLQPFATAVLCGDFNFDSNKTWGDWQPRAKPRSPSELENNNLALELPEWVDVWVALQGEDEPGYTFDGATNPACVRDAGEQMRYDRVIMNPTSEFKAVDIRMIGTEPLGAKAEGTIHNSDKKALAGLLRSKGLRDPAYVVKPSDHYGLIVCLDK